MIIAPLAVVEAALLVAAAALGLVSVVRWWRRRGKQFPRATVIAHAGVQTLAIGFWIAFIATGLTAAFAWTALVILTAGQVLGDLLMFASYRARHRAVDAVPYRGVARDVLSFSRPVPALHAVIGAVAWFAMVGICVATLVV